MKKKFLLFSLPSIIVLFLFLFFNINKNNYLNKLPKLQIYGSEETITSSISYADYDKTIGKYFNNKKDSKEFTLNLKPSSLVKLEFEEMPSEISVISHPPEKLVVIDDYKFTSPDKTGIYKYKVIFNSYVNGRITYNFNLNVED